MFTDKLGTWCGVGCVITVVLSCTGAGERRELFLEAEE